MSEAQFSQFMVVIITFFAACTVGAWVIERVKSVRRWRRTGSWERPWWELPDRQYRCPRCTRTTPQPNNGQPQLCGYCYTWDHDVERAAL